MNSRNTPHCNTLICLAALALFASGCFGNSSSRTQLEYRLAVIEGDPLGIASDECKVSKEEPITYTYPYGRQMKIRAAKTPALTIQLNQSVNIRLVDFSGSDFPEMQVVVAEVIPDTAVLNQAENVRRVLMRCDLLVVLNGEPVELERRGTNWNREIPGGVFASIAEAERAFSESGASVRRTAPTSEVLRAESDYWEWRTRKDLWDFHCDSTISEVIRTKDPELYETLSQMPTPNCQTPPVLSETRVEGSS